MKRDFTFIDDIIDGVRRSIENNYKFEIFNLGNNKCEELMDVISKIEKALNLKSKKQFLGMQMGDVRSTFADIDYSIKKLKYSPKTSINEGIPKFIEWFISYSKKTTTKS